MAKKWWQELLGFLGPAAGSVASTFKSAAQETMVEAQQRIKATTRMVIKALTVFLILALGLIYVLSGLAKWLETSNGWLPGTGAMLVGGVLVFLGLFALLMRK